MCAKLGEACVCRLAASLSRLTGLRALDVANNDLGVLPDSVFELPALEHLNISGESVKELSFVVNMRNYQCQQAFPTLWVWGKG